MRDLHRRLKERGFDWHFVKSFVLPEWWQDELADVEANRALAEAYIAKQLGFNAVELRHKDSTLTLPLMAEVGFKRYQNQIDDRVRAAAIVAQCAAKAAVRSLKASVPRFSGAQPAREVRDTILRSREYVDLDSLLAFCWEHGIAVMQLVHRPAGSKGFDGMAAFIDECPVIVLASGRHGPPWLAFYVAHELGHIMLGHVQQGALVDGTLARIPGSAEEREADRFACEVLSGIPEPRVQNLGVRAEKLAVIAAQNGPAQGVDPGVYALLYAKSNDRWPVAQNALTYLGLDTGGANKIIEYLENNLSEVDVLETDERLISVLRPRVARV